MNKFATHLIVTDSWLYISHTHARALTHTYKNTYILRYKDRQELIALNQGSG